MSEVVDVTKNCLNVDSSTNDLTDVFDESETSEMQQTWKVFDKYSQKFYNAGFREAVTREIDSEEGEVGQGGILQEAFDAGYSTAFLVGKLFGNLRATLALTKGIYEEGRLTCTPEQLESLTKLFDELNQAQVDFTKYVEDQKLLNELDQKLLTGDFTSVDQLNEYWSERVNQTFDLKHFADRLRTLLKEMKCPWDV